MSNLYSLLLNRDLSSKLSVPLLGGDDASCVPYAPPLAHYADSVADRRPSPRKRGSSVGSVADPFRRRRIFFESRLEYRHLMVLIANPNVVDIREQQTCSYFAGGRRHRYTADLLTTFKSGLRVAYEVKYRADVSRSNADVLLEEVAAQVGDSFADEYRLLTELHINDAIVANSEAIIWCARDFDASGQEIVRSMLCGAPGQMTLQEIGERSGLGGRGQRAAIALIQQGVLSFDPAQALSPRCLLQNRCRQ